MILYTRVVTLTGGYYTKETISKKHHKDKLRVIGEPIVLENFKSYKAEINVYFEEQDRTIHITPFSSPEDILKYLGPKFVL